MKKRVWLWAALPLLASACNMLEPHPYDARVTGETGVNASHVREIEEKLAGRKSFRFARTSTGGETSTLSSWAATRRISG